MLPPRFSARFFFTGGTPLLSQINVCRLMLVLLVHLASGGLTTARSQVSGYYTNPQGSLRVVVFVHGYTGDARGTWSAEKGAYWPALIATDSAFLGSSVYLVSYRSGRAGADASPSTIADRVLSQLRADGIWRFPQIHFIAHSLGGIVVRRVVARVRNEDAAAFRRVRSLSLLASPTQAASVPQILTLLTRSFQVRDVREYDSFLESNVRDWNTLRRVRDSVGFRVPFVFCAFETVPTPRLGIIVSQQSATAQCDDFNGLDYDHGEIARPANRNADAYRFVRFHMQDAEKAEYFPRANSAPLESGRFPAHVILESGEPFTFSWNSIGKTACMLTSPDTSGVDSMGTSSSIGPGHPWYPMPDRPTVFRFVCTEGFTNDPDSLVVSLASPVPRGARLNARAVDEPVTVTLQRLDNWMQSDTSELAAIVVADALRRLGPRLEGASNLVHSAILLFDARLRVGDKAGACGALRVVTNLSLATTSGNWDKVSQRLETCGPSQGIDSPP